MAISVLIVDVHAGYRRFARRLLQAERLDVVGQAVDGSSALTEVRRLRQDLVVLDVLLSDVAWFAVVRRLPESAAPPQLAEASGLPAVVLVFSRGRGESGRRQTGAPVAGSVREDEVSGCALCVLAERGELPCV